MNENEKQDEGRDASEIVVSRRRAVKIMGLSAAALFAASAGSQPAYGTRGSARRKSYKIVYKLNGGRNPVGQVKRVRRGGSIAASSLKKPAKSGYDFCGWYSDEALSVKAKRVRGKADVAKRRVYARWAPSYYAISFKLNGGKNPKKQVVRVRRNKSLKTSKLKKPTRRGYTFDGWFADAALSVRAKSVKGKPDAAKRRVYARWKLKHYKVAYKLKGGSELVTLPKSYTVESSTFAPPRPVRDGYYFAEWCSDSACKKAKSKIKKGSTGKVTLYAHWKSASYWDAQITRKCEAVNALAAAPGASASSFVFITDIHVPSNALVFPYLVKQALSKIAANMVVFGGDAINYHANRQNAIDMISFLPATFASYEFHFVRGNHDANTYHSKATAEARISDAELIRLTAGKGEVRVANKLYYHRDDSAHRIRYIMCDSGVAAKEYIDAAQVKWLKARILELGEGWSVLLFVHRFFGPAVFSDDGYTQSINKSGEVLTAALDDVYETARATIIGVLSGHCHRDFAQKPSKKGYPYVVASTTCDAYAKVAKDPSRARTLHSDDEQAFEIVTIDTANKMLHLTRVGWGLDRSFSYAAEPVADPDEDSDAESPSPTLTAAAVL